VLLRRRPEKGLLGGMMEVPGTDWAEGGWPEAPIAAAERAAPVPGSGWRELQGLVRHSFTHFHLELKLAAAKSSGDAPPDCVWCLPDAFGDQALPTVMRKVVAHALKMTG
jgi:A/G-specific adenine glycosylase